MTANKFNVFSPFTEFRLLVKKQFSCPIKQQQIDNNKSCWVGPRWTYPNRGCHHVGPVQVAKPNG